MNASTSENNSSQNFRALIIAVVFLVAILANLILSVSLGFQTGEWQQFARAGVVFAFGVATVIATIQIRRGRSESGIQLIIYGFLASLFGTALLLANFGLILGLIEILLTSIVATLIFASQKSLRMITVAVITAAATYGLDFLPLYYRIAAPSTLTRGLPIIAGIVILALTTMIVWQTFKGKSLRNKILVPILAIATLILSGIIIIRVTQTNRNLITSEYERLLNLNGTFNNRISLLEDFSVALATEVANNPAIQEAFANKDRERLIELTLPSYLVLNQEYDIPQYQFHLPPATSFLRLHQLDQYGDDLKSFRATVVLANSEKRPVSGIEIGRGGLGIRGVVPVNYQGTHIGTVEFGLNIDQTLLNELQTSYGGEWQIMLLKEPADIATFVSTRTDVTPPLSNLVFQTSTSETPIFSSVEGYNKALNGENNIEIVSFNGGSYAILSSPLYDFSGNIIGIIDIISSQTDIIQQQNQQITNLSFSLIVTMLLIGTVIYFLVTKTLDPIIPLTKSALAIAAGDLNQTVPVSSQDELGVLAQTFNQMSTELKNLFGTLEKRVEARTKDLETVAEVGTATATILDTNQLLQAVVDLTKERFNLYHSHIYLLDDTGENLVLAKGSGEAGRIMASEKRSIPINREQSLVARAARERKGVIVNDVTQAPDFLPNPLLPDTRAELAVPMLIGQTLIGVFDIQSELAGRFTDSDANIQTTLAAQLASSVQNARLFERSRSQAEFESVVNTISQKIQQAATVEETLQTAIRELGTAIGTSRVKAVLSANQKSGNTL